MVGDQPSSGHGQVMVGLLSGQVMAGSGHREKSRDASFTFQNRQDGWSNKLVFCFPQIGLIHKQAIVCTMGRLSGEANS